jgi:hypothetical protein
MDFKSITINPKDDVASVTHLIKASKDRQLLLIMKKGTNLLYSSDNLRVLRKTGEVLGKVIKVSVDANDDIGMQIAQKAGILFGNDLAMARPVLKTSRIKRSDIMRPVGDIKMNKSRQSKIAGVKGFVEISEQDLDLVENKKKSFFGFSKIKAKLPIINKQDFFGGKIERPISRSFQQKIKSSSVVRFFVIGIGVLIILVLTVSIFLPQANITIYARSEPVSRDVDVTIDKNLSTTDVEKLMVQGIPVSKEMAKTKTFTTTGVKLDGLKSQGFVRLYNFTNSTLTLRKSTTTLVANGKNYFFAKDLTGLKPTLRKTSDPTSDIDPGSLIAEVEIIAENPGESYNLPANTKFTIINNALGDREVYAMNDKAIGGGQASAAAVVSEEDINKATTDIVDNMFTELESGLSAEQGTNVRIMTFDGVEILAKTPNKNIGEVTENFDMTVIARVTGLAYKESEINFLLQTKIQNILSADKYLVDDARKNITIKEKSFDKSKGIGIISVHYETTIAYRVNTASLAKLLTGKTESEIKEILLTKPEIDQVAVKFSPFFVHKSPRFSNKVKIISEISK